MAREAGVIETDNIKKNQVAAMGTQGAVSVAREEWHITKDLVANDTLESEAFYIKGQCQVFDIDVIANRAITADLEVAVVVDASSARTWKKVATVTIAGATGEDVSLDRKALRATDTPFFDTSAHKREFRFKIGAALDGATTALRLMCLVKYMNL